MEKGPAARRRGRCAGRRTVALQVAEKATAIRATRKRYSEHSAGGGNAGRRKPSVTRWAAGRRHPSRSTAPPTQRGESGDVTSPWPCPYFATEGVAEAQQSAPEDRSSLEGVLRLESFLQHPLALAGRPARQQAEGRREVDPPAGQLADSRRCRLEIVEPAQPLLQAVATLEILPRVAVIDAVEILDAIAQLLGALAHRMEAPGVVGIGLGEPLGELAFQPVEQDGRHLGKMATGLPAFDRTRIGPAPGAQRQHEAR